MTTTSGNRSLPGSPAPIHHHHPHHHHAASSSSSPRGFMHPHPTQLAPQEPGMGHQGYMLPVSRTTQYPVSVMWRFFLFLGWGCRIITMIIMNVSLTLDGLCDTHRRTYRGISRRAKATGNKERPFLLLCSTTLIAPPMQLHDSFERQRYLENIVRSQAEQIQESQTYPPDANKAIETMRSIYMMSVSHETYHHHHSHKPSSYWTSFRKTSKSYDT